MPEKIELAIYGGLSEADQLKIEQATPTGFPNVETAIAWGFEQGVFEVINHARNAYDVVKRECQPRPPPRCGSYGSRTCWRGKRRKPSRWSRWACNLLTVLAERFGSHSRQPADG